MIFLIAGSYMLASSTNKPRGSTSVMTVNASSSGCLSFFHNMRGTSVGRLNVYHEDTMVFTLIGEQTTDDDKWKQVKPKFISKGQVI